MDLYQILVAYNPAWTVREVIFFVFVFIAALLSARHLLRQERIRLSQAISGLFLLTFLAIVFGSTVFTRMPTGQHQYELELFWSWKLVAKGNRFMLQENLLNLLLLFPAGILLPWVWGRKVHVWQGLLIGMGISLMIELCQLVLGRGLFEWDDIVHNGLGCMAGCILCTCFLYRGRNEGDGTQ